jgi:hypothetical protein
MSDEQLSPEEQQELAGLIAESLAKGETPEEISQKLVENGWEQEAADEFVNTVAHYVASAERSASYSRGWDGGMSWAVWIGVILFINLLSWLFNWDFFIY